MPREAFPYGEVRPGDPACEHLAGEATGAGSAAAIKGGEITDRDVAKLKTMLQEGEECYTEECSCDEECCFVDDCC